MKNLENLEEFILLDDRFQIQNIDRDSKFTKVFRVTGVDDQEKTQIELDVNFDIYPMAQKQSFLLLLTQSMGNSQEDKGIYVAEEADRKIARFEKYEYVMHGKIYRISTEMHNQNIPKTSVYASFGGLLMKLTGEKDQMKKFVDDTRLFLLIRLL